MKTFKKINSGDYVTGTIQDNVAEALDAVNKSQIIDGGLMEDIDLVSGQTNLIAHRLGRTLRFWILVRQDTNSTVWETQSDNPELFLTLNCSSNCKVSLWIG